MGGGLYQDTGLVDGDVLRHPDIREGIDSFHFITIMRETLLHDILQSRRIKVNSAHHQVVNKLGDGLSEAAKSSDGIIEALEMKEHPFILSVQWHPERMQKTAHTRKMFQAFIDYALKYKHGTLR
jgi:putative glutamine amidotransferase